MINFDNLTPEERSESKKKEAGLITIAKVEKNKAIEIAKNLLQTSLTNEEIAKHTGLNVEEVKQLRSII